MHKIWCTSGFYLENLVGGSGWMIDRIAHAVVGGHTEDDIITRLTEGCSPPSCGREVQLCTALIVEINLERLEAFIVNIVWWIACSTWNVQVSIHLSVAAIHLHVRIRRFIAFDSY